MTKRSKNKEERKNEGRRKKKKKDVGERKKRIMKRKRKEKMERKQTDQTKWLIHSARHGHVQNTAISEWNFESIEPQ